MRRSRIAPGHQRNGSHPTPVRKRFPISSHKRGGKGLRGKFGSLRAAARSRGLERFHGEFMEVMDMAHPQMRTMPLEGEGWGG